MTFLFTWLAIGWTWCICDLCTLEWDYDPRGLRGWAQWKPGAFLTLALITTLLGPIWIAAAIYGEYFVKES